ncbi:glycosyltransferase family 2 protein [Kluyvera cryocrescens]|uniref:glycosyltransferase family 2 protein n=1 Tax=Kluyvera cryocrescens TaxID=580 RepID=UPI003D7F20C8
MKKNILVSVIIPMYNVEKFIEKCISSVIKQTYKNIEIILIDDGSPDNSGYIAEKLAKLDSRIFVTRTENNGVSSARNLGIRLSTGKYLVFVDGDDYLAPDYIDYMMTLALNSGAEFVMSRNCRLFPGDDSKDNDFIDNITVWSPEKAATELLYPGRIEIGCWNKFF